MKNEIQQILKIVKNEQELNAHRCGEILKIVTSEQELNAQRYHELKSSIDDIKLTILPTLATKEQLNHVYESLSQDITYLSGDHHKLRKRVDLLEKKQKNMET